MFPNETTSTFQVTSEQFPLLFNYVSNVSYSPHEKTLSLTLPLFTIDENNNISMVADSKYDKHGTFASLANGKEIHHFVRYDLRNEPKGTAFCLASEHVFSLHVIPVRII